MVSAYDEGLEWSTGQAQARREEEARVKAERASQWRGQGTVDAAVGLLSQKLSDMGRPRTQHQIERALGAAKFGKRVMRQYDINPDGTLSHPAASILGHKVHWANNIPESVVKRAEQARTMEELKAIMA